MNATCKKNDVVALEITKSAQYAFGSGRGRETHTEWQLGTVIRSSADGIAKKVKLGSIGVTVDVGGGAIRVHCLPNEKQDAAKRALSSATASYPGTVWKSADELRAAILAA